MLCLKKELIDMYEFSDKGEKDIICMNKITGEIESINVRDENATDYYSIDLKTPNYFDVKMH